GRAVQVAAAEGIGYFSVGSLQLKEVRVRADSIGASVDTGDEGGDHLLHTARQVAFGEVQRVREADDLAEEVRPQAHALEDAGDPLSPGLLHPLPVGFRRIAR